MFEIDDHVVGHERRAGRQLVAASWIGCEFAHDHPQITFEVNEQIAEFGIGLSASDPERCLQLIDGAVGSRRCRIFRNTTAVEQSSGAVIALARVDLHGGEPRAHRPLTPLRRSNHDSALLPCERRS